MSENADVQNGEIKSIQEFGILNSFKYKRYAVDIDTSSDIVEFLSTESMPRFKTEDLFLKVLVEGKASLFYFEGKGKIRFFYGLDDLTTTQLIYKKYLSAESRISENNSFRQQLHNNFSCKQFSPAIFERINYNEKELVAFFISYNSCEKSVSTNYNQKKKQHHFNLTIRPGINFSSLELNYPAPTTGYSDFGNKLTARIGLEAEFVLPLNKNKWSLLAEPTFRYFKSQDNSTPPAQVNYQALELILGIRHTFFVTEISKVFINAGLNFIIPFNSSIVTKTMTTLDAGSGNNFIFGAGYKHSRLSLELQYGLTREILSGYVFWYSRYSNFSIIVGYSLFKKKS